MINIDPKERIDAMKRNKAFNDFRFAGLDYEDASHKYYTMNRITADETKVVVKVADAHLVETRYGYALILDYRHVQFLVQISFFYNCIFE